MDNKLQAAINEAYEQTKILGEVELAFLSLEAEEKPLFSRLFLKASGKSIAEREAQAYASEDWIRFSKGLALAKSKMLHERRIYEQTLKRFDAEYITFKLENDAIKRGFS